MYSNKYSGQEIKLDGVEYLIMNEEDVLAIADVVTAKVKAGTAKRPLQFRSA
jgi:hypothetical protein